MVVYLDATGGLCKPLFEDGFQKMVLNYAMIVPIQVFANEPSDLFPMTEMISENHDHDTIGNNFIIIITLYTYVLGKHLKYPNLKIIFFLRLYLKIK